MTGERLHFSLNLLRWYDKAGRHDLPWQKNKTPYRVWVSEIMLQQTGVTTVVPYFLRFMQRFPTVRQLADADVEEVMTLWAGLGYYARARYLHQAAQQITQEFHGRWPKTVDQLTRLPGIGRSTAGAILSLACGQVAPILDGNVKRVLCRFFAIQGWSGQTMVQKKLWAVAEELLPQQRVGDYNQALMDLGSLVCTHRQPRCHACPVKKNCLAFQSGEVLKYPTPKPRKTIPEKEAVFLMLCDQKKILLEKRPTSGIWGGLWCFPEFPDQRELEQWLSKHIARKQDIKKSVSIIGQSLWHTFSHYKLHMHSLLVRSPNTFTATHPYQWHSMQQFPNLALPAPIKNLFFQNIESLVCP